MVDFESFSRQQRRKESIRGYYSMTGVSGGVVVGLIAEMRARQRHMSDRALSRLRRWQHTYGDRVFHALRLSFFKDLLR